MYKSIIETKKLFEIERIGSGQLDVKASKYLLSLSDQDQIEVLSKHLVDLKKNLAQIEMKTPESLPTQTDSLEKAQLQVLIQVTDGLLTRI